MDNQKSFKYVQSEFDKNYEKWMNDDKWSSRLNTKHGKKIAMCLENQRLYSLMEYSQGLDFTEKAYEIYQNFIGFDIVSVQPMLGPASRIYFTKNNELSHADILAKSYMLKETDSLSVANELNRKIIKNLRDNVGTTITKPWTDNKETICSNIFETFTNMIGFGQKWIVTGPDIIEILTGMRFNVMQSISMLSSEWNIVVDPLYTAKEILVGFQDDLLDGYFYSPYLIDLLTKNQLSVDYGKFYISRHGKKLISNKAYGKIIFN